MKNGAKKILNEIDKFDNIKSRRIIKSFENKYVLISNSDILTNLDYEKFYLDFLIEKADLAVLSIPYEVKIPYAVLETKNNNITNFVEKPTYTYYSNGGIYLLKRELLEFIPVDTFFNATDLIQKLLDKQKKIISYPFLGYWLDIGKHEDFNNGCCFDFTIRHVS